VLLLWSSSSAATAGDPAFYTYSLFYNPTLYESNRRSETVCERWEASEVHLPSSNIFTKAGEKACEVICYIMILS
jgi:hypothetical protein